MKKRLLMIGAALLCIMAVALCAIRMIGYFITGNELKFNSIAIGLDQAANAALNGAPDETISSRAGRKWPRFAAFVNWLFQDPNHCTVAIRAEVEGWQRAK